ncbi:MAG: hypothetical protein HC802_10090 [Caldilineaceae bacterium]|nr:hypothetical protein [Caldilineaceae bacterium]
MIDMVPSPSNGLLFCNGCYAEMLGTGVYDAIRHFGKQGKIFYVHFRNVAGQSHDFKETFIDSGDIDMFKAMQAYKEVGFDGVMIPDHLPEIVGDSPFRHRSNAYAIGQYSRIDGCRRLSGRIAAETGAIADIILIVRGRRCVERSAHHLPRTIALLPNER